MKKFLLFYVFYLIIAFMFLEYEPLKQALMLDTYYTLSVVSISKFFIELVGINVSSSGAFLYFTHDILEIKFGCNGLEAILLFCAAVLAYPSTLRAKIVGIFVGSSLLQVINIARIVLLGFVLEYHREYFDVMHEYITQSMMVFLALVVFIMYLNWIDNQKF